MPRVARVVVPGVPHHVTQRGNNRQDVFFDDEDRRLHLALLKEHAARFELQVLGYCLMSNHVHLVAIPGHPASLAKAIGRTDFTYTQAVNRARGWSGHLWQNRFFSCPLEDVHLWRALCYVDRNPVRAGLVRLARRHPWSSAEAHCGGTDPAGLIDPAAWRGLWGRGDWAAELRRPEDAAELRALRQSTHTGRPLGSERFVAALEAKAGRLLHARAVGRPRKAAPPASPRAAAGKGDVGPEENR